MIRGFTSVRRAGSDDDVEVEVEKGGERSPRAVQRFLDGPPDVEPRSPAAPRGPTRYVYFCAFLAALNSANLGYDIGVVSGAAVYVQEDLGPGDGDPP